MLAFIEILLRGIVDLISKDLNKPVTLESIFFVMNGILAMFAFNYLSNSKDNKFRKLILTLLIFTLWNLYYFAIARLIIR